RTAAARPRRRHDLVPRGRLPVDHRWARVVVHGPRERRAAARSRLREPPARERDLARLLPAARRRDLQLPASRRPEPEGLAVRLALRRRGPEGRLPDRQARDRRRGRRVARVLGRLARLALLLWI